MWASGKDAIGDKMTIYGPKTPTFRSLETDRLEVKGGRGPSVVPRLRDYGGLEGLRGWSAAVA